MTSNKVCRSTKTLLAAALCAPLALAVSANAAGAKELKSIGITVGSLGNPYFVAMAKGATDSARKINPNVQVNTASADYDLNKQSTQMDNFISAGVDLILLNAVDPKAIGPAVKRAQAAGIVVVAGDVASAGVDATVMTDNVQAGAVSCAYLAKLVNHKGNVVIENGPHVSSVIDRVDGCKQTLAKEPGIKLLAYDQDGKGSRDGGLAVMEGYLTRFPDIAGEFAINDPQAIGSSLAAKQLNRDLVITSVDGAPDIVTAIKSDGAVKASASQDPYKMGGLAVTIGNDILNGKKPAQPTVLLAPMLVTKDNLSQYQGWSR